MEKITSVQNPKIKNLKRLEKASERKEQQLILIEGLREIVLAARAGYQITSLFICQEIVKQEGDYTVAEIKATQTFLISKEVYDTLAYRETTEGIIATAKPKKLLLQSLVLPPNPLILVLAGVEKPGNIGGMLRTCDAAAVDAVIICDGKTDVYNPNVIRSSIGTNFTTQIAVCETSEAIFYLKQKGITTFAAELTATDPHYSKNFRQPAAVIVGTESTGLSAEWIAAADEHVKIPMLGKIDSLNVSVSAGILLFEAVRQRQTEA